MKLLAIDTAMAACSVAVIDSALPQPLGQDFAAMERGHAEAVAPMVERAMAEAGITFSELQRIAVTTGPGTFTGVRIGLSLARGFGVALNIPAVGLDSLMAIARNLRQGPVLVVADARKDEVYAALFDGQLQCVRPPAVKALADAARGLPAGAAVIGTAADLVIAASGRNDLVRATAGDLPVAANFAHYAAGLPEPAAPPAPLYLRSPDAKPQAGPVHRAAALSFTAAASAEILAQIHGECFDRPWPSSEMAKLLAMPGSLAITALEGGEPVAFVLASTAADEAEIIVIATRPFARRRGIAQKLVTELSQQLTRSGARSLFLEVAAGNTAARHLYAECGFAAVATRARYYANGGDALVMRRDLAP
jgi:tRNA threonylcarbamoyl adenosine modification protein YeaZ/ribosomal-protein-alanine acetyltransferase